MVAPAGPEAGEIVIEGVGSPAKVAVNGNTNAPATTTIVAVAIRSRQRVLGRCGASSVTQRVPSQNDNVVSIRRPG